MKRYVLKIPMSEREKLTFFKAHAKSGFSTMSEFVRFVLRKYMEENGRK